MFFDVFNETRMVTKITLFDYRLLKYLKKKIVGLKKLTFFEDDNVTTEMTTGFDLATTNGVQP